MRRAPLGIAALLALAAAPAAAQRDTVERQWGDGLVRSWNEEGWIDAPARIGAAIAPLIGAGADEVIVTDHSIRDLVPGEPLTYAEAVRRAVAED